MSNDRDDLIREVGVAVRIQQNAVDEVDEAAADFLGVNRTDMRCIDIIDRVGRLSAGQLASESGLSTGAVTTALDRLEARGYVRRMRDRQDRRKVLVEVTEKARRKIRAVYGPVAQQGGRQLSRLSDEQLASIRDFLYESRDFLVAHAARVRDMAAKSASARRGAGRD